MRKLIFIGGCERSGTTFCASRLGAYQNVIVLPESQFLAQSVRNISSFDTLADVMNFWASDLRFQIWGVSIKCLDVDATLECTPANLKELFMELVEVYARAHGQNEFDYIADHTPSNMWNAFTLGSFFEDSLFVHLVRDGRAVANSVLNLDWGPNTILEASTWWLSRIGMSISNESRLGSRCTRVYYEEFIKNEEAVLLELAERFSLKLSERKQVSSYALPKYTANQHQLVGEKAVSARIDGWKKELTEKQIRIFEQTTFDVLPALGYEKLFDNSPAIKVELFYDYLIKRNLKFMKNVIRNKVRKTRI